MSDDSSTSKRLRVGVIGAGEVAQVVHLPTLAALSHLYITTAICDVSAKTTQHCAEKFHIPFATTTASEVYSSPDVDVVFVLTSDEYHEPYIIGALEAGKHVMVEKPMTLSLPSAKRIIAAQKAANKIVFVGYMRRYAPSFQVFKQEVASMGAIQYVRSRDFPGPNPAFVAQSGAFVVRHLDDISDAAKEDATRRAGTLVKEAFDETSAKSTTFCRFMNTLGSHDISLMREVLGIPEGVAAVSVNDPFYAAIFNYRNKAGAAFSATYESGWDDVADFDAHLAVYSGNKRVWIKYDTPFVKGLAIKVHVQSKSEHGIIESREIVSSYEDAYTAELQELYECVVNGKEVKTSAADALLDQEIFDMMYRKWEQATT